MNGVVQRFPDCTVIIGLYFSNTNCAGRLLRRNFFRYGDTMIYIYNCYGGTHTSSLASEIHLKQLPADRKPTKEEILGAKYFNKLGYKDMGKIIFRGVDDEGSKVYTLGRGMSKAMVPCLESFIGLIHNEGGFKDKVILSNMSPTVPPFLTAGGFFSRGIGLDFIGVPLLVIGAKQAYDRILKIVWLTREKAKSFDGPVLVLDNKDMQI